LISSVNRRNKQGLHYLRPRTGSHSEGITLCMKNGYLMNSLKSKA